MSSPLGTNPVYSQSSFHSPVKSENKFIPDSPPLNQEAKEKLCKKIQKKLEEPDKDTKKRVGKFFAQIYDNQILEGLPKGLRKEFEMLQSAKTSKAIKYETFVQMQQEVFSSVDVLSESLSEDGWSSDNVHLLAKIFGESSGSDYVRLTITEGKVDWALFSSKKKEWFQPTNNSADSSSSSDDSSSDDDVDDNKQILVPKAGKFDLEKKYVDLTVPEFIEFKAGGKRHGSDKESILEGERHVVLNRKRNDRAGEKTREYDVGKYGDLREMSEKNSELHADHMPQSQWVFRYYEKLIKNLSTIFEGLEQFRLEENVLKRNIVPYKQALSLFFEDKNHTSFLIFFEETQADSGTKKHAQDIRKILSELRDIKDLENFYKDLKKVSNYKAPTKSQVVIKTGNILKNEGFQRNQSDFKKIKNAKLDQNKFNEITRLAMPAMCVKEEMHSNSRTYALNGNMTSTVGEGDEKTKIDRLENDVLEECMLDRKHYFNHALYGEQIKSSLKTLGAFRYHYKQVVKTCGYFYAADDDFFIEHIRIWKNNNN